MMTARRFLVGLCCCMAVFPGSAKATWKVRFDAEHHAFTVLRGKQVIIAGSVPEADFGSQRVSADELPNVTIKKEKLRPSASGGGMFLLYQFSDGLRQMTQTFWVGENGVETRLTLSMSDSSEVESNHLMPLQTTVGKADSGRRFLKVPYDNDDFVRYHVLPLDTTAISYEVAALFGGNDRGGILIGSIEHDHWKSAVALDNGRITACSGVSTKETRDVLPHGALRGRQVSSARFLITASDDWRSAFDSFTKACSQVQKGRCQWPHGAPFGWQSWGVLAEKNSFQTDLEVSDYMAHTLRPAGFCAHDGTQVLSVDAWDNLSKTQKTELCRHVKANGQVPGTYVTPFCLWWNDGDLDRPLFDGSRWTGRDACIKVNGKPYKYDGAFCLDPTHPATHAFFHTVAQDLKDAGFEYFKIDFTCNGMIQADSYHEPSIRTAVEAYNYGFQRFIEELDRGGQVFTALSIAPIFPYQYGNSRRIACDTWGSIEQSEYAMNAISYGWWTGALYQFNDPDHLVLVGKDAAQGKVESLGENRARYTTGVVSGMLLIPDVWSITDRSGRGSASLSFERAKDILMNEEINRVARLGHAFRPVYGDRQWRPATGAAENLVVHTEGDETWLAAINYSKDSLVITLPLADIGLPTDTHPRVHELWMGQGVEVVRGTFEISVPPKDARLYQIQN